MNIVKNLEQIYLKTATTNFSKYKEEQDGMIERGVFSSIF